MYKTEGYRITKSNYSTYRDWVSTSSNDVIKNTHVGDIYRVGEDCDGYITFGNKYRLYPDDDGYINTGSERNSLWRQAEFCAIYGSVIKSSSDDGITIIPKKVLSNTDISAETQYEIKISNFFRAKIIKYVEYNGKTELYDITQESESVLDMLSTYVDGLDPAEVLIYMSEGNVKLMAVTKGF